MQQTAVQVVQAVQASRNISTTCNGAQVLSLLSLLCFLIKFQLHIFNKSSSLSLITSFQTNTSQSTVVDTGPTSSMLSIRSSPVAESRLGVRASISSRFSNFPTLSLYHSLF